MITARSEPAVVAVIGSRNFPDLNLITKHMRSLSNRQMIVSGGARGVDAHAKLLAQRFGRPYKEFAVTQDDWLFAVSKWHAANIRNELLVRFTGYALGSVDHPGVVCAYWTTDPKTGLLTTGTGNTLGHAQRLGVRWVAWILTDTVHHKLTSDALALTPDLLALIPKRSDQLQFT